MKKSPAFVSCVLVPVLVFLFSAGCHKKENPIKYKQGTFPDSVYNLTGLNTEFDDYNSNIMAVGSGSRIVFSSNRGSSGGQFDLVHGTLQYQFLLTDGEFSVSGNMSNDAFYNALVNKATTPGNDFGPYSTFSSIDGYDYFFLASQSGTNPLDIYYMKYLPPFGTAIPAITGPLPARVLNSGSDDAYISLDSNGDSVYFSSNRDGNFNIYLQKRPLTLTLDNWLTQDFSAATKIDSINSNYEDKCPFFFKNILLFASNRPGGLGGYDLYYSVFKNGKWRSPVNLGPGINSDKDEFRPVLGYNQDFDNMYIVYSSNRPGGKGGYDLYFTGVSIR
jgi:hypothetical protein